MKRVRELCTKKNVLRGNFAKIFKAPVPQSLVLAGEFCLNNSDDILQRRRVVLAQLLSRVYQQVNARNKNISISSAHFWQSSVATPHWTRWVSGPEDHELYQRRGRLISLESCIALKGGLSNWSILCLWDRRPLQAGAWCLTSQKTLEGWYDVFHRMRRRFGRSKQLVKAMFMS